MYFDELTRPISVTDEFGFFRPEYLREHAALKTGVRWLDSKLGGFERPQVVLLDGPRDFTSELTSRICVEALTDFDRELVFVDGGNSVDLFGISELCKAGGHDPEEVLSRITVSRAFTAHQFASLINGGLDRIISDTEASTLVVSCFVDLFLDDDMPWYESLQLIKRSLAEIRRVTGEFGLVSIITNHDLAKIRNRRVLRSIMFGAPDKAVVFEERKAGMLVTVPKQGQYFHRYYVPDEQRLLDNYGLEEKDGEDRADV
jgi:hypothetical protein